MTERELATIIAALRLFKEACDRMDDPLFRDGIKCLEPAEIDALIKYLLLLCGNFFDARRNPILELAREQRQRDGDIEFDDDAVISENNTPHGDNGCYVQAWVWIEFDGTPFSKPDEQGIG